MPTAFIAGLAVTLPSRFAAGDIIDDIAADVLNDIQHRRVKARLRRLLERNELAAHEIEKKVRELFAQELTPYSTLDDEDTITDPIMIEALALASEIITKRLAAEGIPVPKGIDTHARALVDAVPTIQEQARLRVEARFRAAEIIMGEQT